jgi:bifunctional non-homologous end joining protein LigD
VPAKTRRPLDRPATGLGETDTISAQLVRLGAVRQRTPPKMEVMLAGTADRPFSAKGWLFELKYDGFRVLASKRGGKVELRSRRGNDLTAAYPEVVAALEAIPHPTFVLDGEVVVLDERGRSNFQGLQKRAMLTGARDIAEARQRWPVVYFAFDLLAYEDLDARPLKLVERKAVLRQLIPPDFRWPLRFADHLDERGLELFEQVQKLELEGMMAKEASAPYEAGRSKRWLKVCVERRADLAIIGFSPPEGGRLGFGAAHLGAFDEDGHLVYVGRVGSGFSDRQLQQLRAELETRRLPGPPCPLPSLIPRSSVWVRPELVCEVRYKEMTEDGLLRAPVFLRMRDDKPATDCVVPARTGAVPPRPPEPPKGAPGRPEPPEPEPGERLRFARLDKVFWPEDGYTKRDLIDFYRRISPWLLPYLKDRPAMVTRYPDGITGKSFFQKDAAKLIPPWVKSARVYSEADQAEVDVFVVNDLDSLLYVANLAAIPIHLWSSRLATLHHPDWCILDLDPKGAPFVHVVKIARAIHALCEDIGLPTFPKTSGSTGLHVFIPLGQQLTHEQSIALGQLLATVIVQQLPDIATINRVIEARGGRVYVDFLQNGEGRLIASPFCVRPRPGAPVSTTLEWGEVTPRLDQGAFTIRTVFRRLEKKGDPMRPVLELAPDVRGALEALGRKLGSG